MSLRTQILFGFASLILLALGSQIYLFDSLSQKMKAKTQDVALNFGQEVANVFFVSDNLTIKSPKSKIIKQPKENKYSFTSSFDVVTVGCK